MMMYMHWNHTRDFWHLRQNYNVYTKNAHFKIWEEDLLTEHRWIYCFAHQMVKTSSIFCGFDNKSFFAFSLLKRSIKQIIPGCMYFNFLSIRKMNTSMISKHLLLAVSLSMLLICLQRLHWISWNPRRLRTIVIELEPHTSR